MCVIKEEKIFYSHNLREKLITLIQIELEPVHMNHLLVNLTTGCCVYVCFCVHLVRMTKLKEVFACHGFAVHTNEQHVHRNGPFIRVNLFSYFSFLSLPFLTKCTMEVSW